MDRQIPHVLDVFTSSPGARRRMRADMVNKEKSELQKNPGSDSAVSVGSTSEDEEDNEEQRHIAKYFDYLNESNDTDGGGSSQRRKKKKKSSTATSTGGANNKQTSDGDSNNKKGAVDLMNQKNSTKQFDDQIKKGRQSRRSEFEKDIRHIERHLSMKKTIRKKIMRDLQQAFVEDPKDLQQDPKGLTKEKKNIIDISNLTLSRNRLSKSEHNFLDMLKDDHTKERKGLRALIDFRKDKPSPTNHSTENKDVIKPDDSKPTTTTQSTKDARNSPEDVKKIHQSATDDNKAVEDKIRDDDSGHGSPTREPRDVFAKRSKSKDDLLEAAGGGGDSRDKKQSFWKRITGKGSKSKR